VTWRPKARPWHRVLLATLALCAQTCSADEAFYRRAADCATADQIFVVESIPLLRPNDEAGIRLLVRQVELGLSFAGTAYKQGLREPLATDLLKLSNEKLSAMTPRDRDSFRLACDREAQALWDGANGFERWLVKGKAKLGMKQLLEDAKNTTVTSKN
jgi:hypothetical protein